MTKIDYLKAFIAKLHSFDRSKRIYDVFRDFLTLSTCALAQVYVVNMADIGYLIE